MGQEDIGDYFKNRLSGQPLDIDTEAVWNDLDLPKKQRKNRFLWMLPLGLLFLIGGSILLIKMNDMPIFDSVLPVSINVTMVENDQDVLLSPALDQVGAESDEKIILKSEVDTKRTGRIVDNEYKGQSNVVSNNNLSDEVNKKLPPNLGEIQKQITPDLMVEAGIKKTIVSKDDKNEITRRSTQLSELVLTPKQTLTESDLPSRAETFVAAPDEIYTSLTQMKLLDLVPSLLEYVTEKKEAPEHASFDVKKIKNHRFALGVYSGILTMNRGLSSSDENLSSYLDIREQTEEPLEMMLYGAKVSFQLKTGLSLGVGLEYQVFNEVFKYSKSTSEMNLISNAFGNTFQLTESAELWKQYNRHQLFNLPITVGYHWLFDKWSLGAAGSIILNFNSTYTGKHLDINNEVRENPSSYRNGLNLGYRMELKFERAIQKSWSLELRPMYQVLSTTATSNEFLYDQSFKSLGCSLGLRFKL